MPLVTVDETGIYWLKVTGNRSREAEDWYNNNHKK